MIILVGSMGNRHVPVIIMVEITGTGVAKKKLRYCLVLWTFGDGIADDASER